MQMLDLRRIATGVKLTQADLLESQLMKARVRNAERARQMAHELGSKYLLSPEYDGHYRPELTRKAS